MAAEPDAQAARRKSGGVKNPFSYLQKGLNLVFVKVPVGIVTGRIFRKGKSSGGEFGAEDPLSRQPSAIELRRRLKAEKKARRKEARKKRKDELREERRVRRERRRNKGGALIPRAGKSGSFRRAALGAERQGSVRMLQDGESDIFYDVLGPEQPSEKPSTRTSSKDMMSAGPGGLASSGSSDTDSDGVSSSDWTETEGEYARGESSMVHRLDPLSEEPTHLPGTNNLADAEPLASVRSASVRQVPGIVPVAGAASGGRAQGGSAAGPSSSGSLAVDRGREVREEVNPFAKYASSKAASWGPLTPLMPVVQAFLGVLMWILGYLSALFGKKKPAAKALPAAVPTPQGSKRAPSHRRHQPAMTQARAGPVAPSAAATPSLQPAASLGAASASASGSQALLESASAGRLATAPADGEAAGPPARGPVPPLILQSSNDSYKSLGQSTGRLTGRASGHGFKEGGLSAAGRQASVRELSASIHQGESLKPLWGATVPKRDDKMGPGVARQCYDQPPASEFALRGKNYMKDKKKEASRAVFYEAMGMDAFSTEEKVFHVARRLQLPDDALKPMGASRYPGIPDWLVVTFLLPMYTPTLFGHRDGANVSLVLYYRLAPGALLEDPKHAEAANLVRRFMTEPDSRDTDGKAFSDRFKILPRCANVEQYISEAELSSAECKLLRNYNNKPLMARPQFAMFRERNYLEIDLDVHLYNFVARRTLHSFVARIVPMVFDLAFCIQGNAQDELPEALLCATRVYRLDMTALVTLPGRKGSVPVSIRESPRGGAGHGDGSLTDNDI